MGLTVAFPRGWTVNNLRDRLLVYTKKKDALMQITIEKRPEKQTPREYLLAKLKGGSFARGTDLSIDGMEGYALITRSGSPLDGGEGPVRWAALYRDKSVFLIGGASRSSTSGAPIDDGIFMSSIQTMRHLKPSEYPLAQPYRLKIVTAAATHENRRLPQEHAGREVQEGAVRIAERPVSKTRTQSRRCAESRRIAARSAAG